MRPRRFLGLPARRHRATRKTVGDRTWLDYYRVAFPGERSENELSPYTRPRPSPRRKPQLRQKRSSFGIGERQFPQVVTPLPFQDS